MGRRGLGEHLWRDAGEQEVHPGVGESGAAAVHGAGTMVQPEASGWKGVARPSPRGR